MQDIEIVELFFRRNEDAIAFTKEKYNAYLSKIAKNILDNFEDAEECVSDTYVKLWDSVPPNKPESLGAYSAKITRNLALNRLKAKDTQKRGGDNCVILDELDYIANTPDFSESTVNSIALSESLDRFLSKLKTEQRVVFIRRYWFFDDICAIAERTGYGESKIKSILLRTRKKLKKHLLKEDITL